MQCPSCHSAVQGNPPFCPSCGAALPREAAPDPHIGRTLAGKYKIVQLLGEGGMGAVYVGEQALGTKVRKVAIKTLHAHLSRDEAIRARFQRECETLAGLQHSNTVQVFDFGTTDDGLLYIVMEFVQGRSIALALEQDGPMSADRVTRILEQIGGSLAEAHAQGIIHRDLKPDNVVLTERAGQKDFVKVLDFGIAKRSGEADRNEKKLTQQGMVLGTPPYMSPEQFTGQALDARSDIYSLGVMAYEMLTGQLPFDAATAWEWATMHMTAAPKPIEAAPNGAALPESMRAAVMRALAKNPDQRFASVMEMVERFTGRAGPGAGELAQRMATRASKAPPPAQGAPRTAGMDVPPMFEASAAPADGRPKTQIGEPIVLPPEAFGTSPAPPVGGGYVAPAAAAAYVAPPVQPGAYGPGPSAGYVGPSHGPSHGHTTSGGGRGGKGPILAVAGVVALLSIGAIAWGAGLFGSGSKSTDVPPLDLGSSGATTTTTATTPPPADTHTPPAVTTTTTAPPLTPGTNLPPATPPKTTPAPPKTNPTPPPATPPPATPPATPAPTPQPQPQPQQPPPIPVPTPQQPPPVPVPVPQPQQPPPTPAEPPVCAQARAARAKGQTQIATVLERQCRIAGGVP